MGKTGEDLGASPVTMGKKSKKNKNKINDLPDADGDGNSQVEIDDALPKEIKGHKHREKKKKKKKKKKKESESNEDGVEDRPDKGNLVDDADLGEEKKKKKRESGSNEDGVEDRPDKGNLVDVADLGEKKKKRESGSNEDGVENQPDKGDLVNDGDVSKKDKKKKRKRDSSEETQIEDNEDNQNDGPELSIEDSVSEKSDNKKSKLDAQNSDTEMETQDDTEDSQGTKEKKKTKVKGSKAQSKTTGPVENNTGKPKAKGKGKSKKVSFAGHVEVFPSSDTRPENQTTKGPKNQTTKGDGLVRGKRFTPEEDAKIKDAVNNYIEDNNLGDDGLMMVLNCSAYKLKKCWQDIVKCIPYRPHQAVYNRAHVLFERNETRGFTPEEDETLKKYQEKYGNKWKKIAVLMGKSRLHVKDNWRRIKLGNPKAGKWVQKEYQTLYDLVNMDLKMKVYCEKKSKHGMLRDNIPWGAVSEKLSTRSDARCCVKWYKLRSPLVAQGLWSDTDDYLMIGKLYELDAACVDDVDWDNLLEHRTGDICRKRWDQMVKHIGDYGSKPFAEQVDILAERYSPDLAADREAWDNKPVVP